jgi:hypothetical protein
MKRNRLTIATAIVSLFAAGAILNACVKQNYSTPPDLSTYNPVHPPVNMTCGMLAGRSLQSGTYVALGDSTIEGVVTADDRSGNFYHQIVIQDSTGGLTININQTYLYNSYPIGRKLFINLQGLYLANYKGLMQLCSGIDATGKIILIPGLIANTAIIPGSFPNTVTPKEVRLTQLLSNPNAYYNLLVQIDNVEFDTTSANTSYAQALSSGNISTSLNIIDCFTPPDVLVLYNSAYATFQPAVTPLGNGTITGIFSCYSSPQFLIRDTFDVRMNNTRCN